MYQTYKNKDVQNQVPNSFPIFDNIKRDKDKISYDYQSPNNTMNHVWVTPTLIISSHWRLYLMFLSHPKIHPGPMVWFQLRFRSHPPKRRAPVPSSKLRCLAPNCRSLSTTGCQLECLGRLTKPKRISGKIVAVRGSWLHEYKKVSTNATPIAGWFMKEHPLKNTWFFGVAPF